MKALLICPDDFGVAALAESAPLASISILGKSLVEYWLEHLATLGAKEVLVLAADRPDQVRAAVGNGARWGLCVTVQPEKCQRTLDEARARHPAIDHATRLPAPNDVILMDHLPALPQLRLTTSYADWFAAVRALMPRASTPDRIGVRELIPGVWVGLHARVAPGAELIGPCWIGERACIEADAIIGPNAVLEKEVFIARGATVSHSVIGSRTFVGQFTEVRNSIACGSTLVNWERDSVLNVSDEFLLCSLEPHRARLAPARASVPEDEPLSVMVRLREYVTQLLM